MDERLWYLKRCPLFERLSPEQSADIERTSRVRRVPRGEIVFAPGEASESVYLVLDGRIKLYHLTAGGKEAVLAFIDPGELFGELSVLDGAPREEFAEAIERSQVLSIPVPVFQTLMAEYPDIALGVTKLVGLRRRRIERRLKSLLFRSNRDRLVALLLELAEKYGRRTGDGIELGLRLSHQELANVIGSTRETVTVTLGELKQEGALTIQRRKITLKQLERLARSVDIPAPRLQDDSSTSIRILPRTATGPG
ncbi:MAG: Crp/Fnr family transcriptional regulator [Planctomycetaceae bacterium]